MLGKARHGIDMKSRGLLNLWRGQEGRCVFCDGNTSYCGASFSKGRKKRYSGISSPTHPAHATLTLLARECDGGDRCFDNLAMSCRFCHTMREHPFVGDHINEMIQLIRFGCHPLHPFPDTEPLQSTRGLALHRNAARGSARQGKATNEERQMKSVAITIQGNTPLICNRFTDEAAEKATNGTSALASAGDRGTPREQAEKKLYPGRDGRLIIPQPNLLRCLVEGGRFHKAGKKQITTKKESMLYSCLDIEDTEIPIEHREPWRVDSRPVVNPSTGGRFLCHRPMFDDWRLSFTLSADDEFINLNLVRAIVDDAGRRIGLGDYRPDRKGPFGKFVVVNWAVQVMPLSVAA